MIKYSWRLGWIATLLLSALPLVWASAPKPALPDPPVDLTILYLNDTHGFLRPFPYRSVSNEFEAGGAAWFGGLIQEERAKDPGGALLLSAGDMFQGAALSNRFKGVSMMEVMNLLRFDAMTVGNHEFDWGQEALIDLSHQANFPFLGANLLQVNGRPTDWCQPCLRLERKGLPIVIIGLCLEETAKLTRLSNVAGLKFQDAAKTLRRLLKEIQRRENPLVIVLSHLGLDGDRRLAHQVKGIDLIVGGHSHTALEKPVVEAGTPIVQAGSYGVYLGVLRLRVNPKGAPRIALLPGTGLRPVLAAPGKPVDSAVGRIVEDYYSQIREEFTAVIGESQVDLVHAGRGETNLGNLVCDAMKEAMGADAAIQNSGGIRTDLNKGPITREQLFAMLPFDNQLVMVEITGRRLVQFLKQVRCTDRRTLQVAGMRLVYEGSDQSKIKLRSVEVAGRPLDPDGSYRIVTNDFLYMGGKGVPRLISGKPVQFGGAVFDAVLAYLRKNSPVQATIEGRIIIQEPGRRKK